MRSSCLTLLAGITLLLPNLLPNFLPSHLKQTAIENILYPGPLLVLMGAFLGLQLAAFALPTLLFFVWNPGLFRGDAEVPRRSYVLLIMAAVGNALWIAVGWKYGLIFQGARYNYSVSLINIAWVALLLVVFMRSRKEPSFKRNLLCHWMLFLWLAWYAFPFFGELL
jgi:hypothetical protein